MAELAARADALLRASELERYRALFSQAGEHDDPNRRYHAHKTLLERGLVATGQASSTRCMEIYVAIGEAAIDALEREPAEPAVLNYARVTMYELLSLHAARALFLAVQRLHPPRRSLPPSTRSSSSTPARATPRSRSPAVSARA